MAGGDITALDDLDSVSAINPYIALAGGDINATGDLDSVSAVDTFFGDGPVGAGGVFTGGGLAALEPDADGNGGYALLSAIPALLDIPPQVPVTTAAAPDVATEAELFAARTTSGPGGGTGIQSAPSFAPQAFTPPQLPKVELPKVELPKVDPAATPGGNSGPQLNVARVSEKFEPTESIGKSPFLVRQRNARCRQRHARLAKGASRSSASAEAPTRPAVLTPTAQSSQLLQRIGRARFEPARFFV